MSCVSVSHTKVVVSVVFTNLAIAVQHEKTCTFITQVVQKQVLQCRRRCCKEWLPSLATTEFLFLATCTSFTPALITPASRSSLPCRPLSTVPSASPLPSSLNSGDVHIVTTRGVRPPLQGVIKLKDSDLVRPPQSSVSQNEYEMAAAKTIFFSLQPDCISGG